MSASPAERWLIVNADDFGQDASFNAGTIQAHDDGIVTSASLMVRWPACEEAVALSATRSSLSLGIHLDLGEWSFTGGQWEPLYEVVDAADADAVADEVARQLQAFHRLVGRGPTHVDSHQHTHREEPVAAVVARVADRLGVPVRDRSPVRYLGDFYGQTGKGDPYPQGISLLHLLQVIASLPPGTAELGCHPGIGRPELATVYAAEREAETRVLCDPRVRTELARCNVALRSYHDVVT